MTTTQVRYWELQEGKRHNLATERLNTSQFKETQRHNKETELQGWKGLEIEVLKAKETNRHNVATENLTATDLAERQRHNLASEALSASQLHELSRHNVAMETETHRANVVREAQTERKNTTDAILGYGNFKKALAELGLKQYEAEAKVAYDKLMATNKTISTGLELVQGIISMMPSSRLKDYLGPLVKLIK